MTGPRGRWPQAECLHEDVADEKRVFNWVGELKGVISARCRDCGMRLVEEKP